MRTTAGTIPGRHAAGHQEAASAAAPSPTQAASAEGFAVPGFDAVVRLVTRSLGVPLVSLVLHGGTAYWFADGNELPAHDPRTLHPLYLEAARSLTPHVVLDTLKDERFRDAALGRAVSVPSLRYKLIVALTRVLPSRLTSGIARRGRV